MVPDRGIQAGVVRAPEAFAVPAGARELRRFQGVSAGRRTFLAPATR